MMMMHYEKPADIFHPVQLCVPSRHYFHETRFQFATHYREDVLILLYYLFELRGDLSQRFQHDAGVSPTVCTRVGCTSQGWCSAL